MSSGRRKKPPRRRPWSSRLPLESREARARAGVPQRAHTAGDAGEGVADVARAPGRRVPKAPARPRNQVKPSPGIPRGPHPLARPPTPGAPSAAPKRHLRLRPPSPGRGKVQTSLASNRLPRPRARRRPREKTRPATSRRRPRPASGSDRRGSRSDFAVCGWSNTLLRKGSPALSQRAEPDRRPCSGTTYETHACLLRERGIPGRVSLQEGASRLDPGPRIAVRGELRRNDRMCGHLGRDD